MIDTRMPLPVPVGKERRSEPDRSPSLPARRPEAPASSLSVLNLAFALAAKRSAPPATMRLVVDHSSPPQVETPRSSSTSSDRVSRDHAATLNALNMITERAVAQLSAEKGPLRK